MTERGCIAYSDFNRGHLLFPDDTSDSVRRYGSIAHSTSFDFGTIDFAIEFAGTWDSTIASTSSKKAIVRNSFDMASLNNTKGWSICLIPNTNSIWVGFNDNNATMVSFQWDNVWYSSYNQNNDQFFRLEFDRDVGCTLYANGTKVSTKTEIASRQNTITNTYALIIGGQNGTSTSYLKGSIGLIRFDLTALTTIDGNWNKYWNYGWNISNGATWNKDAYLKYKYQHPFEIGHYRNCWEFQSSLTDRTGGLNSPLTFSFYDGTGTEKTATYGYTPGNWNFTTQFEDDPIVSGHEWGYLDLDSRMRGLDGSTKIYKGPVRRYKNWKFRTHSAELLYALLGAYFTQSPLTIFDTRSAWNGPFLPHHFRGFFASPPNIRELIRKGDAFDTTTLLRRIWEIDIELVET